MNMEAAVNWMMGILIFSAIMGVVTELHSIRVSLQETNERNKS